MILIGNDLKAVIGKSGASDSNFLIPVYNMVSWFKFLKLPSWLLIVIFQAYWLPIWWVNTIAAVLFLYAVLRTAKYFMPIKQTRAILIASSLVFALLFFAFIEYHRYWLLIALALGTGILNRLKGSGFNKDLYEDNSFDFNQYAWRQFKSNKAAYFSSYVLVGLVFMSMYASFIANQLPLYSEVDGKSYYPIYQSHLESFPKLEFQDEHIPFEQFEWQKDNSVFTLIPYSPNQQDKYNRNFKSPRDRQLMKGDDGQLTEINSKYRHWLGTDKTGRDVLSGLIHASKISLSVGFVAMGIAALIGIFFGAIAGFYGDYRLRAKLGTYLMVLIGLFLGYFYAFESMAWKITDAKSSGASTWHLYLFKALIFCGLPVLFFYLAKPINKLSLFKRSYRVPVDALVNRLIEILNSVPKLLLIIVIAATFEERSLFLVMAIIGLTSWTGIARFTRAEFLRIRGLNYIESAEALGYTDKRIIMNHALPNALAPVFVSIAFGVASAILIESSLSFLNIGVPDDVVTWGSMLNAAKQNWEATWMVLFPGLAIFLTITVYNLIGEGLRDALDPKLKK